jgi:hypothetical protein
MTTHVPSAKDVKDLLEGLLGREVSVAPGVPVSPADSAAFGIYVDDAVRMTAVINLDLRLAAFLGASIALIPRGRAEAAIEDRYVSETMFDNIGEVFNIAANVLNQHSDVHQRLYSTVRGVPAAPADAAALSATPANRLDLAIDIDGYGSGALSCVLA